jgi:hypothetical protein
MDTDTVMTDVPDENPGKNEHPPLVLVWVQKPDIGSGHEVTNGSQRSQPTIMIISCDDEQTLREDEFSQQAAKGLISLQSYSDSLRPTISQVTREAEKLISELKQQIPHRKYPWLVKDKRTGDVFMDRGFEKRDISAIDSRQSIEGLGSMGTDTEMEDDMEDAVEDAVETEMEDGMEDAVEDAGEAAVRDVVKEDDGSGDLTLVMSGVRLGGSGRGRSRRYQTSTRQPHTRLRYVCTCSAGRYL